MNMGFPAIRPCVTITARESEEADEEGFYMRYRKTSVSSVPIHNAQRASRGAAQEMCARPQMLAGRVPLVARAGPRRRGGGLDPDRIAHRDFIGTEPVMGLWLAQRLRNMETVLRTIDQTAWAT